MKFSNRRGMQIATSTIVILIVGVVILGASISLTYTVVCKAEEYRLEVDAQSAARIDRLLASSGTVQVADNTKKAELTGSALCGGSRDRTAMFTMGIKNKRQEAILADVNVNPPGSVSRDTVQYFSEPQRIEPGETLPMNILIIPPNSATVSQLTYAVEVDYTIISSGETGDLGAQLLYVQLE